MSNLNRNSDERRTANLAAGRTVDGKFDTGAKSFARSLFNPTKTMKAKQAARQATWDEFFADEPVLVCGM